MSWPQWPAGTQPPIPSVLNPTTPVINPAPAVAPPGLQYSTDQWTQLQQQNWNQWAQWQQQYQQWHQQYGAEYQKSMNAMAQAAQPTAPALPNMTVPPPLPAEIKPPLPVDDPPPHTPSYTTMPALSQLPSYTTAPLPKNNERLADVYPKPNQPQNWQTQNSRFQHDMHPNKRTYDQSTGVEAKRPMVNKPNWQNQPLAPVTQQPARPVKENIEELSEAEKKFDKQFADWEAQFTKWKDQNAEHPDKEQYREYEKKWESWRAQLLERREQMKRKRLGLQGDSPSKGRPSSGQAFSHSSQNYNLPQPPFGQNQPSYAQPALKGAQISQGKPAVPFPILPTPTSYNKPPPNLNDEPLKFKPNQSGPEEEENIGDFIKPNIGGGIPGLDLVKDDSKLKNESDGVVLDGDTEKKGPDFDAISKGINTILGDQKLLNMLSMVSQTQSSKMNDHLTNTVSKINPDGSKPPFHDQTNLSYEDHSNHSENYGQREFVNNFDDQTRSSFTMGHIDQEGRYDAPGSFGRNQKFEQHEISNRFGNFKGNRFGGPENDQFHKNSLGRNEFNNERQFPARPDSPDRFVPKGDRFPPSGDRFNPYDRRFGPPRNDLNKERLPQNQDRFGQERLGSHNDSFGPNQDRFETNQDRFPLSQARFGNNQERFGPNQDQFVSNNVRFDASHDRFRPNQDRFGPNQDRFGTNQNRSGPNQDRFELNQNRLGRGPGQERFGSNEGRFGTYQDKFQDKFGASQDRFRQDDYSRFGPNAADEKYPPRDGGFGRNNERNVAPSERPTGPRNDTFGSREKFDKGKYDEFDQGGPFNENFDESYDYDEEVAQYENMEDTDPHEDVTMKEPCNEGGNFQEKNLEGTQPKSETNVAVPPKTVELLQPATVIDYDHKSLKSEVELEVLIEPVYMFDYRHKALSRIPLPQRPKWLAEAVRNIREFDPPVVRPYEPPNLRRYPPVDNWKKDRYPDDRYPEDRYPDDRYPDDRYPDDRWSSHNRRNYNDTRSTFDDRRPSQNSKMYDEGPRERNQIETKKREEKRFCNDDNRSYATTKKQSNFQSDYEEEKISDTEWPEDDDEEFKDSKSNVDFPQFQKADSNNKPNANKGTVLIEDLICSPGRYKRPPRVVIILRGPPGSGKTFLAKLIKDKEVENGGSTPRILSLDDYFMVEQEKEVIEEGKKVKIKEMVYEYEADMEESYRTSLIKSFKKTITDGYFSFIIVDNVNDKVKFFGEMWSFAKQNGFQVYICQLDLDVQTCSKRNIHGRSETDIEKCVAGWETTPSHHPVVDATSLLQSASIPEVEMEEVNSPESGSNDPDSSEDQVARSKWDNFDCSVDNLAKLDGVSKPLRHSRTMEEYLQLDSEWTPVKPTKPGQKRVRWADLEEQKQQEKMRAIGFVVGQTNWSRMLDPTMGSSALTQTKYIERTGRYKVDQK